MIKYNTDEGLVTETLVTGLIKYNTDDLRDLRRLDKIQ